MGERTRDYEAKLGDVLIKLKSDTSTKLTYGSGSKPVDFENWVKKTRVRLNSRHSQRVRWRDAVYSTARAAYGSYLAL